MTSAVQASYATRNVVYHSPARIISSMGWSPIGAPSRRCASLCMSKTCHRHDIPATVPSVQHTAAMVISDFPIAVGAPWIFARFDTPSPWRGSAASPAPPSVSAFPYQRCPNR